MYAGEVQRTTRRPAAKKKPAVRRTRANGEATVARLLAHGRTELQQSGAIGFNVERVLRKAKVSPSSLYHHFGSRDGFIAALEFEGSYSNVMREIEMLRSYIISTDDPEAFFKASELVLSLAGKPAGRERRRHRIETLVAATRNPALRKILADAQRDGTAQYIEVLRLALEKRKEVPHYPVEGIAYVVQSMLVGRIIVDLLDDDELGKAWEQTALAAMRAVLTGSR